MKIAVASMNESVAEHFGHCEQFHVFQAKEGAIVESSTHKNPGHKPGFLPNYLGDLGVDVIISGGMGQGAIEIFNERGIEVVVGARGDAAAAAELFLKGELKSTGSVCKEHMHEGSC